MITYYDQPIARLENDHLILDYLPQSGPRIGRLIPRGLGDALIVATALVHNRILVTHNTADFAWVPGL